MICQVCGNEGATEAQGYNLCDTCSEDVTAYADKVQARIDRLKAYADKVQADAESDLKQANDRAAFIPMGQPILIGHYSEGRDRRYRERIHTLTARGVDKLNKAKAIEQRAASAEQNRTISADDPLAIAKLEKQLEQLKRLQADMKRINKVIHALHRKPKLPDLDYRGTVDEINARLRERREFENIHNADLPTLVPTLMEKANISQKLAGNLLTPDFAGRIGFPDCALTNNNANIRRIEKRVKDLTAARSIRVTMAESEPVEVQHDSGLRLTEDQADNRLRLFFPGKPSQEVITLLKSRGFHWSPTIGSWQRQLTESARYSAKTIIREYEGKEQ
jgi:hypothetical protein